MWNERIKQSHVQFYYSEIKSSISQSIQKLLADQRPEFQGNDCKKRKVDFSAKEEMQLTVTCFDSNV